MKERIDIVIDEKELLLNDEKQERLKKTHSIIPSDRVPVITSMGEWPALYGRGVTYKEYLSNPREHMRHSILNKKWCLENIPDDSPINTKSIFVTPSFGSLRGIEFPMEIIWPDNQPAKCIHPLTEPEQIDELRVPDPNSGLCAKQIQWYREMQLLGEDFDVRLNGEPLKIKIRLGHNGGPIPSAFALAGENLFIWMYTDPERVHRLMSVVTESFIGVVEYKDKITGQNTDHPQAMGADTAEMLSPALFREFVVPYYQQVWERFDGPRNFHMCGKIDHLLTIIRDEMKITNLDGFGFPVEVDNLRNELRGRCVMSGGPHPMLVHDSLPEEVIAESVRYIKALGDRGGYILCIGGGAVPGTPRNNYLAMIEASKRAMRDYE